MTGPSGEPYQVGDDAVTARLEVDIPTDAVQSLTDLNRLTSDIRANMEATAKYNQDYVSYLRELPNAINEVSAAQGQLSGAQSSIFGGSDDPFAGRNYGNGASVMGGQSGSGRPMRGADQDTLVNLARNNPRQIANMAADRGLDDYVEGGASQVLPRPAPQPGAGREMRGERTGGGAGNGPGGAQGSPSGTGPGNAPDNSAGTGTGRQVGPQGTDASAERAARRLLAELDGNSDDRDIGQRARGVGDSVQNNSLLNFLNQEGGTRGRTDALGFAGGLGRMAQSSAESAQGRLAATETQRQALLTQAGEVAANNPTLAAELQARAAALGSSTTGASGALAQAAPLLKGIGIAGAGVAAVAGVNAAVQNTGETLHSIQGQGVQQGGGIREGLGFEAQIRTMAMNPFISTEQSRKIMQSALQTGYSGKEMDTMTEFMAENLKNMNIEVAESTKLLQQNVLKGGQDAGSVQAQLQQNVAMAGQTNMSADQINQAYTQVSGQLIDAGAGGAAAGGAAQGFSTLLEGSDVLKGSDVFSRMITSDITTQSHFGRGTGMIEQGIPTAAAGQWGADNLSSGEMTMATVEAVGKRIETWVKMYASGDQGAKYRAVAQTAKILGVNNNQAQEMLDLYASGKIFDMARENESKWEEQGGGKMDETTPGGVVGDIKKAGSFAKSVGSLIRGGWNIVSGDMDQAKESFANVDQQRAGRKLESQLNSSLGNTYAPEVLKQLAMDQHGGNIEDVTIVEGGKERKLRGKDLRNEETMKKLQGGEIKVKTEEGGVQSLRDWGNTANTSEAGSGGMTSIVELGPEAKKFFNITSTPNQKQQEADRGVGSRNATGAPGSHGPQGPN